MLKIITLCLLICLNTNAYENSPNWSSNFKLEEGVPRDNIYNLSEQELKSTIEKGQRHTLLWPVDISGLYIPYEAFKYFLESDQDNSLKKWAFSFAQKIIGFSSLNEMYEWLGMSSFNDEDEEGIFSVTYPDGFKPDYAMGASIQDSKWGKTLTFSCATCHSQSLFGKTVFGLTNKRPRANEFFHLAKTHLPKVPTFIFKNGTKATKEEVKLFKRNKKNIKSVGSKKPRVLGLDTSLAQVALSLARRNSDEYATKSFRYQIAPKRSALSHKIADSKPSVWWNLKYKNRWLSDGSLVSGNPVLTNFLWNELGRGTDLYELEKWMKENPKVIRELTTTVFSTKPPRWTDFFAPESIDLAKAKRGKKEFENRCSRCHGSYEKAWEGNVAELTTTTELLETTKVIYHEKTPVKDVGTDPGRYQGMKYFSKELNELAISKWMKTEVVPQKGYVPPPLVGIFARYPYMHNNSMPSLCDVLSSPEERTKVFYQGPADDPVRDFDSDCVGYPTGSDIPEEWKKEKHARFNTSREGLRNTGHSRMLKDKSGNYNLSRESRADLIEFLKTL